MLRDLAGPALLSTLVLTGCGGGAPDASSGRFTADVRENFLGSCLDNAVNSSAGQADEEQLAATCECILDKVEAQYSEDEFTQFEQRLLGGTASDAESDQLAAWSDDCAQP